jgi:hypothetical protein
VIKKLLNTALESLFGGGPANTDTIPLRAARNREHAVALVENASSLTIPSHPVRVVGNLLALTDRQRDILRSMTASVTANEYGKVEGNNAVFVSSGLNVAAVTLHAMGFSRERDGANISSPRFVKTIQTESGFSRVATAWIEKSGDTGVVYTLLSVD